MEQAPKRVKTITENEGHNPFTPNFGKEIKTTTELKRIDLKNNGLIAINTHANTIRHIVDGIPVIGFTFDPWSVVLAQKLRNGHVFTLNMFATNTADEWAKFVFHYFKTNDHTQKGNFLGEFFAIIIPYSSTTKDTGWSLSLHNDLCLRLYYNVAVCSPDEKYISLSDIRNLPRTRSQFLSLYFCIVLSCNVEIVDSVLLSRRFSNFERFENKTMLVYLNETRFLFGLDKIKWPTRETYENILGIVN